MMKTVLITGGCGFIGSNLVWLQAHRTHKLVIVDALTYAGNKDNIAEVLGASVQFYEADIADRVRMSEIFQEHRPHYVINLAAESHVDRSIGDSAPFIQTNVVGTQRLLDLAREYRVEKFLQVSTDEVYGSLELESDERFTEYSPIKPSSPYAASKAAADMLAVAYWKTHKVPVVVTRCSNNYGHFQHPEKFIPRAITEAVAGRPIPIYSTGVHVRDWIHVSDHCDGLWRAMVDGRPGEVYCFGGDCERNNTEVARHILRLLGKPTNVIEYIMDRKGHDLRYAVDFTKASLELGWSPRMSLDAGLLDTVEWYRKRYEEGK